MQKKTVNIQLQPLGKTIETEPSTPLQDVLFEHGVEFPCGGHGQCQGCRVQVSQGVLPVTRYEEETFSSHELEQGWRLACCHDADCDMTLKLEQWSATILSDESSLASWIPTVGTGIAVDLGTTTIVAQLVDLQTGEVLAVESDLNPQAQHGADLMRRLQYSLDDGHAQRLASLIRATVGDMVASLLSSVGDLSSPLNRIVVVGNSAMHHLFCAIDATQLAYYPFQPTDASLQQFTSADLGWALDDDPPVFFLPCIGGFVGSDILAGIHATELHQCDQPRILIDLGTNGEIVLGCKDRILCTSTAAGPAFEGGGILQGMRAATGAISSVALNGDRLEYHVLGHGEARGLCGSGLVDAVAVGLNANWINPTGRIETEGRSISLCDTVSVTQRDIRQLQLAKAAIAAGIQILIQKAGLTYDDIEAVYLAGAFGNYIDIASAQRIGLFPAQVRKTLSVGNTALKGAKLALIQDIEHLGDLPSNMEHLPLNEDTAFQACYIDAMSFPNA